MDSKYKYTYEKTANYCYEGTDTLINKLNITNDKDLFNAERELVSFRTYELNEKPLKGNFDFDYLKKIHKYLFQDVYAWAGQYRKVNISKSGNPFMPIQSFSTAQDYINHLIHTYYQTANSKNKIIKQLAKILDNLNYFHPFREGNGRTQREVIRSLALSKGYSAQIRVEQDDEVYNLYMDGTVYGDLGKLEELLGKILEKL